MILVTGAAGFIGSIVTEHLIQNGYQVMALDNLSSGHRQAIHPRAEFAQLDLTDRHAVRHLFLEHEFEAVVHLAAESVLEKSMQDPGLFYRVNVVGGLNLLDAMVETRVNTIIFSSTAAVHGIPQSLPISEDHPVRPATPYGETKLAFEKILDWYQRLKGIQYITFRYFNACGASEHYGDYHNPETHIISVLLETALGQREMFPLYGTDYPTSDGTCIRDYVHVLDIAQAHLLALSQIRNIGSSTFNLGNSRGHSNREIIATVEQVTGKKIKVSNCVRRTSDPAELIANSQKARDLLGWKPHCQDLTQIVESAWLWRQSHPKGYAS